MTIKTTTNPKPDVAGARERLKNDADWPNGCGLAECKPADIDIILSAYDRQGEDLERLRGDRHFLLETLRRIDGVVKDGLDPSKLIAVGLEYGDMDQARARQGGPDHG